MAMLGMDFGAAMRGGDGDGDAGARQEQPQGQQEKPSAKKLIKGLLGF
jgi:hypothetical protein